MEVQYSKLLSKSLFCAGKRKLTAFSLSSLTN